jgi:hypothetical protein
MWSLLAAVAAVVCGVVSGKCVFYEECGDNPVNGKKLGCLHDGPAVPLGNAKASAALLDLCPYLDKYENESTGDLDLCCSARQVTNMVQQFSVVGSLLGRCPACLVNFKNAFCHMSCSPDQSDFLEVTRTINLTLSDVPSVTEVNFHVAEEFVNGVYDSCKDVVSPSTSGTVMDLLCGAWGSNLCTPKRLFHFLGDLSNGNTPLTINFVYEQEGVKAFNETLTPCSAAPYPHMEACSCTDCQSSCSPPNLDKIITL